MGWLHAHGHELAQIAPEFVDQLREITGRPEPELRIHVVGNAGVGKSTLLNVLLSDRMSILPHGGFGSLTACATRIRYSSDPRFSITYRGAYHLSVLIEQIEQPSGCADATLSHARLLVQGSQFGDGVPAYLAECLRHAVIGRVSGGADEADRARLQELAQIFDRGTPKHERHAGTDLPAFLRDLEVHGAGFLAPLVEDIEIGWHASFLAPGIELVDLPGAGVANDSFAHVTKRALAQARGVMLVVDRSGLTQDVAELLGPLFSAMHFDEEPRTLVVAVAKIDTLAADRRADDPSRTWAEHFERLCAEVTLTVRKQLRTELHRLIDGDRTYANALLQRVIVQPVAPLEHQRFHRRDPEDPARVKTSAGAQILALRAALHAIAVTHAERVAVLVDQVLREAEARSDHHAVDAHRWRETLAELTPTADWGG